MSVPQRPRNLARYALFLGLTGVGVGLLALGCVLGAWLAALTWPHGLASATAIPWTGTPTWTPLRPLPPTGAYTPTATPTFTPSPVPTPTPRFGGRVTLFLLGMDRRLYEGHAYTRTDTLMLAVYNPETGALSLISFPRDLYVRIPGRGYNRINVVMEYGGFPLLQQTMQANFGLPVQYYVLVDLGAFKRVVEALNGLDVYVPRTYCDRWYNGRTHCVQAGWRHMNADEALWYARARAHSNDFSRMQRQQQVVKALIHRLWSFQALQRAPQLYLLFRGMVETNITPQDIPRLVYLAHTFREDAVYTYAIKPPLVRSRILPSGAYVLMPNQSGIQRLLEEAFSH